MVDGERAARHIFCTQFAKYRYQPRRMKWMDAPKTRALLDFIYVCNILHRLNTPIANKLFLVDRLSCAAFISHIASLSSLLRCWCFARYLNGWSGLIRAIVQSAHKHFVWVCMNGILIAASVSEWLYLEIPDRAKRWAFSDHLARVVFTWNPPNKSKHFSYNWRKQWRSSCLFSVC